MKDHFCKTSYIGQRTNPILYEKSPEIIVFTVFRLQKQKENRKTIPSWSNLIVLFLYTLSQATIFRTLWYLCISLINVWNFNQESWCRVPIMWPSSLHVGLWSVTSVAPRNSAKSKQPSALVRNGICVFFFFAGERICLKSYQLAWANLPMLLNRCKNWEKCFRHGAGNTKIWLPFRSSEVCLAFS